ncbi:MAG TPA: class I SAM-dependent methyltransferase [Longilinea sp.]|nr:class I SAM-dependent methyltransferase [Longilinea sp.]
MTKPRVKETDQGIQGELLVETYDRFQRGMRDKGWIETKTIIQAGIDHGHVLELGHGPGYVGLEWLKLTKDTHLTGIDISPDMVALAERNAREYGLADRATYVHSNGDKIPFEDEHFDAVFTTGSMHEWEDPRSTFAEIWRVLKPGGIVFISDLRRDMSPLVMWFLWLTASPREIRPGLITSINAAYLPVELEELVKGTELQGCKVIGDPIGLSLVGVKQAVV